MSEGSSSPDEYFPCEEDEKMSSGPSLDFEQLLPSCSDSEHYKFPEPSAPALPIEFEYDYLPPYDAKYELDNGFIYYLKKNEEPKGIVDLTLVVKAAAVCENAEAHGVAHLIEHLAFHGCGYDYCAHENSDSIHDGTIYRFVVNNNITDVVDVIALMARIALKLVVTPQMLEKERRVVLEELWINSQNREVHQQALDSLMYKGTKYWKPSGGGTKRSLLGLSVAAVEEFYRKFYIPSNMAVIVVGDLTPLHLHHVDTLIKYHFRRKEKVFPQILEIPFARVKEHRLFVHLDSATVKSGQSRVHFTFMLETVRVECLEEAFTRYRRFLVLQVILGRLKALFSSRLLKQIQHSCKMCSTFAMLVECEGSQAIAILETFIREDCHPLYLRLF